MVLIVAKEIIFYPIEQKFVHIYTFKKKQHSIFHCLPLTCKFFVGKKCGYHFVNLPS